MERRIGGAGEADGILIVPVARLIIAVEEDFGFINAAVQKTPDAAAGMMVLAQLVDEMLTVDIVEVKISA